MKYPLLNQQGKKVGDVDLPERIFNVEINSKLVHDSFVIQQGASRSPIAHTKGRGEVRGGGKKPWKQKGTGQARHGSTRSPIWRGGGVTFGPTNERNFEKKINKKAKQKALFMALSQKARDKELTVVDSLKIGAPKTKEVAAILKNILNFKSQKIAKTALIITELNDKNLVLAARNLNKVKTISPASLNIVDLLENKFLIMPQPAIDALDKTFKKTRL